MRKFYFLVFVVALFNINTLQAQQNIILGGSMETADEENWSISNLQNDETSTTAYAFGYTDDYPDGGTDGSLYLTATNSGANGSHLMVYQAVTLTGGQEYVFDLSAKATIPMLSSWFEVYVGLIEPADSADYAAVDGEVISLGGFKSSNWAPDCDDNFDGTLQEIGCLEGSQGAFIAPGEGEQTYYIGFKVGIWAEATTIEFVVDNISLVSVDSETGSESLKQASDLIIFPNPVDANLSIQSNHKYNVVRILNISGQEILNFNNVGNQIDVSSLEAGTYIIELLQNNNPVAQSRFVK